MSDGPALPITWRPRRARVVPYLMAVVVVGGGVVLAIMVAPPFGLADRIGLVLLALAVAGGLHLLGRCRLTADEGGLTVVNAARTHHYEWAEVLRVNMGVGEPWPTLDLADGSSAIAMGIQSSDGERAQQAVAQLRALLVRHGEAPDRG